MFGFNPFCGPLLVRDCLVSNYGGCTEGKATLIPTTNKWDKTLWLVEFLASRGKGGKEQYWITFVTEKEDESFILV